MPAYRTHTSQYYKYTIKCMFTIYAYYETKMNIFERKWLCGYCRDRASGESERERQREGESRGERRWKMTQRSTCHSRWCHPRRELTAQASWGAPVLWVDWGPPKSPPHHTPHPLGLLGELSSSTRSRHTLPLRVSSVCNPATLFNQSPDLRWQKDNAHLTRHSCPFVHISYLER